MPEIPEAPEMLVTERGIHVAIIIDVRAIAGISVIVIGIVRIVRRGIVRVAPIVRNVTKGPKARSKMLTEVGKLKFRAIPIDVKRIYEGRVLS